MMGFSYYKRTPPGMLSAPYLAELLPSTVVVSTPESEAMDSSCCSSPSSPCPTWDKAPTKDASPSSYSFQCCVCLDLLCKPVVLSCGHVSCFWCRQKSMHGLRASHCMVCRRQYLYFPGVCWLLHHLLLKIDPVEYERREMEMLEEEKHTGFFSPQVASNLSFETVHSGEYMNPFENLGSTQNLEGHIFQENRVQNGSSQKVAVADLMCAGCNELLFQPAVFNCGHVFCESCMSHQVNGPLKCQACESLHPGDFPNVCLELDHFVEEQFPVEYAARRQKFQLEILKCQSGEPLSSASESSRHNAKSHAKDCSLCCEELSDVHVGVGCDSCGMYPIIGRRYKCKDCKEKPGFDLCEACYNTSSKLPGRFNQKHTPDHELKPDNSKMLGRLLMVANLLADGANHEIDPNDSYELNYLSF